VNEFELIARYFDRAPLDASVRLAVGDDAAIVAPTIGCEVVATVDMLVEGRHFLPDVDPEALGHKTLAVNLSDLAAMGARPRWALLAGALPRNDPAWIDPFARGLFALAAAHHVSVIGGDTTRGPLNLCVTALGEVPAGTALRRDGARAGDDIYVSGSVGEAALAIAATERRTHLDAATLAHCRGRLDRPLPRVALGLALRGIATSAIDVSDGLVGDLAHVLERSRTGARIDLARVPTHPALAQRRAGSERTLALACTLAGGDDYELCFTAPAAARVALAEVARELALPLTPIGTVCEGGGLVVLDEHGVPLATLPRAFDHFAATA
jgi:thiamine-monophosphate kinase